MAGVASRSVILTDISGIPGLKISGKRTRGLRTRSDSLEFYL
jgi:hypothetical protein